MSNKAQRERKTARDKKKRWDMAVSSIKSAASIESFKGGVSEHMCRALAQTASDLNLTIIGLVALEALRVKDLQREIAAWEKAADMQNRVIAKLEADLAKAQEVISKMNLRYLRRGSRKARAHHPEKRR
jgi:hypothetical protein